MATPTLKVWNFEGKEISMNDRGWFEIYIELKCMMMQAKCDTKRE
jgi:hypothetical protein